MVGLHCGALSLNNSATLIPKDGLSDRLARIDEELGIALQGILTINNRIEMIPETCGRPPSTEPCDLSGRVARIASTVGEIAGLVRNINDRL